jgi:competence protein ComFC
VIRHALRNIRDGLLNVAYPHECRCCGGLVDSWDDGVVCSNCWDNKAVTMLLTGPLCKKCGAPGINSATLSHQSADRSQLCGKCSNATFNVARACGIYSGSFEASILSLKVTPHICPRLKRLISTTLDEHRTLLESDLVIPIPLHQDRERKRGFNQASVVAKSISKHVGPFDDQILKRTKATDRHRAGMDAMDRALSVEKAFVVAEHSTIEGATVLLIDDVYTTGSTVSAASRVLLAAGAARVNVFTIARVGNR